MKGENNMKQRIINEMVILSNISDKEFETNIYARKKHDRLLKDVAGIIGLIKPKMQLLVESDDKDYYKCYIESLLLNIFTHTPFMWDGKDNFLTVMSQFYDRLELPEDTTLMECIDDIKKQRE